MDRLDFERAAWPEMMQLYNRPGIADLCLALQDDHGADVILFLTLHLLDQKSLSPTAADLATLVTEAQNWQVHVVEPLRVVRRWMKPRLCSEAETALREKVKALELEGEKAQLTRLCTTIKSFETTDPAGDRASDYLRGLDVPEDHVASLIAVLNSV